MKKNWCLTFLFLLSGTAAVHAGDHDYFDSLTSRPDHWKSYSFRNSDHVAAPWITYNPPNDQDAHRQDAVKVVIPAFNNKQLLPHNINATDKVISFGTEYQTAWQVPPQDGTGRYARIGDELMLVLSWNRTAGTVTFERGSRGTQAASHTAGDMIQMNVNSLPFTERVPLETTDGSTYLFTWDSYWTDSYINAGFSNHKTFQFSSGSQDGDAIWLEVDSSYGNGDATTVATVHMRSYNKLGGVSDWSLTDGDMVGPGATKEPVGPMLAGFKIKPNTWVRYWVRIQQRANDYDYMDFWIADENNNAVKILNQVPLSVRPTGKTPNSIQKFWIEFNTSTDELVRFDLRDLVAYVRNFVALKNPPADITPFLQRPVHPAPLPAPAPSAPKIVAQPVSISVNALTDVSFSVSVTGTSPFTYQWKTKSPTATGFVDIPGATSRIYSIVDVPLTKNGSQYQCVITNSLGSVTSAIATLGVVAGGTPPPPEGPLGNPTLSLPAYLPINSQITAGYTGSVVPAYFSWTFTPVSSPLSSPAGISGGSTLGAPLPVSFNTPSPIANLGSADLELGPYLITVIAHGTNGNVSQSASAQVTFVSAELAGVKVYPNPWKSNRHADRFIRFDGLTSNTTIKIFTVSGHHVRTLAASSSPVDWDLADENGDKVASGIYLYAMKTDQGGEGTGKVVIIK